MSKRAHEPLAFGIVICLIPSHGPFCNASCHWLPVRQASDHKSLSSSFPAGFKLTCQWLAPLCTGPPAGTGTGSRVVTPASLRLEAAGRTGSAAASQPPVTVTVRSAAPGLPRLGAAG